METNEVNIINLAVKIQALETKTVVALVNDIAKYSKKKRLESGSMFFGQFCEIIARNLTKQTTKVLIKKYNLV